MHLLDTTVTVTHNADNAGPEIPKELLDHAAASSARAMLQACERNGELSDVELAAWEEIHTHVNAIQGLMGAVARDNGDLPIQGLILVRALGTNFYCDGQAMAYDPGDCPDLPAVAQINEHRTEMMRAAGIQAKGSEGE